MHGRTFGFRFFASLISQYLGRVHGVSTPFSRRSSVTLTFIVALSKLGSFRIAPCFLPKTSGNDYSGTILVAAVEVEILRGVHVRCLQERVLASKLQNCRPNYPVFSTRFLG